MDLRFKETKTNQAAVKQAVVRSKALLPHCVEARPDGFVRAGMANARAVPAGGIAGGFRFRGFPGDRSPRRAQGGVPMPIRADAPPFFRPLLPALLPYFFRL